MKTKFSQILKIRKEEVSKIELQLASKRAQKEILLTQITEILSRIYDGSNE